MKIISHRGYWKNSNEKNELIAFERSFNLGFGIETDIRDFHQKIIISHDPPSNGNEKLQLLLKKNLQTDLPLALNIKSDGIAQNLIDVIAPTGLTNWFAFDMSIPDMMSYINLNIPVFTRMSDIEPTPILYKNSIGVWLDCFSSNWYKMKIIDDFLRDGKKVCIVSPELHQRDHIKLWSDLRKEKFRVAEELMLCTDFPEDAQIYFNA